MTTRTTRTKALGQTYPTDCGTTRTKRPYKGPVRPSGPPAESSTRTKKKTVRVVEPWPPPELCPCQAWTYGSRKISRGGEPEPEPPSPHDTATPAPAAPPAGGRNRGLTPAKRCQPKVNR